ncbi:4-hydroxyphenylacetate 3-hydroxylase N-terminal domain-containing protein [Geodermatophilus ruber]|uniref:4-hydroxyphenylacetate 3-monooxygenase oxygenase component n=1 Tax=Geodermatophilus ruber TaxID=504800 RepID=A0A1I4G7Y3_9ACTN|nr:4-hydroxyphenylacetate 3-hydroxylase N-terminal domain-containing protein [Geodermatophilus ruber]SFL25231.1 4-hydroxyphenylacetate 3-monooxygenase oxygenase component [Geodermatophilus ruber]
MTEQLLSEPTGTDEPVATRPQTGDEYLESLRDGREVWFRGERVEDVTTHPAFRNSTRMIARLYDALHDETRNQKLVVPTDTGNGGMTHAFFKAPYTVEDLQAGADACAEWARQTYGFMGRTPDYKAGFLSTLGSNTEYYSPFQDNARRWYKEGQEKVLYFNHAIVNPPVDRNKAMEQVKDVYMHVEKETDAGLHVSGAKVVATGSVLCQYNFIGNYSPTPIKTKEFSAMFAVPMATPGVKLISRPSYEYAAGRTGSPFDNPLSSRLDENDSVFIFDNVFVPWENVFCYDPDKASEFYMGSGFIWRGLLQGCIRYAVKLDFLCGVLLKSLEMTGTRDFRGVQTRIGELITYRHLFWSLVTAMVQGATKWSDGTYVPNVEACTVYRIMGGQVYPRIRDIFQKDIASALIYTNSSAQDWGVEELRPYLDKYVRGSNGFSAEERVKVLKLAWDAIGTDFGSRHELYERNYAGNHEQVQVDAYLGATAAGRVDEFVSFVDQCMSEYDTDGWTVPDLIDPRSGL